VYNKCSETIRCTAQSNYVFDKHKADFMKDVINAGMLTLQ